MSNVLFIDASPRKESVSRVLAHEFLDALKAKHADLSVQTRDLTGLNLQNLDDATLEALRSAPANPTESQKAAIKQSDALIEELKGATAIVIAAPMHNFSIPASLRTWIDHVVRPGLCFGYGEQGPYGLLDDKPVLVVSTRGGAYGDPNTSPAPYDQQTPYIKQILGFIGLSSVSFIAANGLDMAPESRETGLAEARAAIPARVDAVAKAIAHS